MKTFFNKEEILHRIKEALGLSTDKELADFLGINKSTLANWVKRNSIDWELVFSKCEQFNLNWIINGEGAKRKQKETLHIVAEETIGYKEYVNKGQAIPLVEVVAVGGFGNAEFAIGERDVKDYYVVPKFKDRKIDFMIEVSGSSMYPKYNSGDVVACRIIRESKFIQWNKVHVIATKEQGILIKRLKKSQEPKCLLAISDNKDYEPFDIPENEITGIALVMGVIRLE